MMQEDDDDPEDDKPEDDDGWAEAFLDDGFLDDGFDDESGFASLDHEAAYLCDNCGEEIVIPIDFASGDDQSYVEDCPVCCSPNLIHVHIDGDQVIVRAEAEQDRY